MTPSYSQCIYIYTSYIFKFYNLLNKKHEKGIWNQTEMTPKWALTSNLMTTGQCVGHIIMLCNSHELEQFERKSD